MDEKDQAAYAALMQHAPRPGSNPVVGERVEAVLAMEQEQQRAREDRAVLATDGDWVS